LDSEDKQFGYIIDYKDLFSKVKGAVKVYTSELDYDTFGQEEVDISLKSRLATGKERLDKALEEIALICEPVHQKTKWLIYGTSAGIRRVTTTLRTLKPDEHSFTSIR